MVDVDCNRVSPRSSRSPSPSAATHRQRPSSLSQSRMKCRRRPPKSIPLAHSHRRRLSVSLLADRLNAQTLHDNPATVTSPKQRRPSPVSPLTETSSTLCYDSPSPPVHRSHFSLPTPSDTDYTDDEGCDPLPLPVSLRSISRSSCAGPTSAPSPTSTPSSHNLSKSSLDFSSLSFDSHHRHPSMVVRSQRERLSFIQCGISGSLGSISAADMGKSFLLPPSSRKSLEGHRGENECHPSSLPHSMSPNHRSTILNRARRMHNSSVSFPTHLTHLSSDPRSGNGNDSRNISTLPSRHNSMPLGPLPLCTSEKVVKPRSKNSSSSSSSLSTSRNTSHKQMMLCKALNAMLEAARDI